MTIDGVTFVQAWAKKKTEAQFVKEFVPHTHIYPNLKGDERVEKLKEVYRKLVPPKTPDDRTAP